MAGWQGRAVHHASIALFLAGAGALPTTCCQATPRSAPHLAEVTGMVLVHHDPMVVLPTSVTAATGMLPVLAHTAVSGRHMPALLPVLAQACHSKG